MNKINTIVFDLGGVLIDWNPRYLYRKIFKTEDEITWFMENICTSDWNDQQDAGRSFEAATTELVTIYPEHEVAIRAWYDRWQESIGGAITGTVEILDEIRQQKVQAICPDELVGRDVSWALDNFEFLHWFEGIVVSGKKTRKPFADIYDILIKRHVIEPGHALFIDDNIKNIHGAQEAGLQTIRFESPEQLRKELMAKGIL